MNDAPSHNEALQYQLAKLSVVLKGPRSAKPHVSKDCDVSEACKPICGVEEILSWRDIDQRTALHAACELSLRIAAGYIIEKGGRHLVTLGDSTLSTPLHEAAQHGSAEMIQLLLDNGAEPGSCDRSGVSPLHHAASGGYVDVVVILQQHGAKVDSYSGVGTPLHWAAGEGQCTAIEKLLELGCGINTLDSEGVSPLGMAAVACQEDAACLLLDAGAKPCISRFPCNMTEMHVAAELGMERFICRLLKFPEGMSACSQQSQGRLPVHVAATSGHESIARMLLPVSGLPEEVDMQTILREASALDGGTGSDDEGWSAFASSPEPFPTLARISCPGCPSLDDECPSTSSVMCTPPASLLQQQDGEHPASPRMSNMPVLDAVPDGSPNKRPKSDQAILSPSRVKISKLKLCTPIKRTPSQLRLMSTSQEGVDANAGTQHDTGHVDGIGLPMLPPLKRPIKLTLNVKRTLM